MDFLTEWDNVAYEIYTKLCLKLHQILIILGKIMAYEYLNKHQKENKDGVNLFRDYPSCRVCLSVQRLFRIECQPNSL